MPIDATEFGSITIDGKTYEHDVIIRLAFVALLIGHCWPRSHK